jgi:hypothetical protein
MFRFSARPAAMIRIDTIWLTIEPMDMRAGTEAALARVVAVFGAAKPHCAYLFANRRANRMKVLVHDGVSAGENLRPRRTTYCSLDLGAMGGQLRRAITAAG